MWQIYRQCRTSSHVRCIVAASTAAVASEIHPCNFARDCVIDCDPWQYLTTRSLVTLVTTTVIVIPFYSWARAVLQQSGSEPLCVVVNLKCFCTYLKLFHCCNYFGSLNTANCNNLNYPEIWKTVEVSMNSPPARFPVFTCIFVHPGSKMCILDNCKCNMKSGKVRLPLLVVWFHPPISRLGNPGSAIQ